MQGANNLFNDQSAIKKLKQTLNTGTRSQLSTQTRNFDNYENPSQSGEGYPGAGNLLAKPQNLQPIGSQYTKIKQAADLCETVDKQKIGEVSISNYLRIAQMCNLKIDSKTLMQFTNESKNTIDYKSLSR